jgi:hypothetical protein
MWSIWSLLVGVVVVMTWRLVAVLVVCLQDSLALLRGLNCGLLLVVVALEVVLLMGLQVLFLFYLPHLQAHLQETLLLQVAVAVVN